MRTLTVTLTATDPWHPLSACELKPCWMNSWAPVSVHTSERESEGESCVTVCIKVSLVLHREGLLTHWRSASKHKCELPQDKFGPWKPTAGFFISLCTVAFTLYFHWAKRSLEFYWHALLPHLRFTPPQPPSHLLCFGVLLLFILHTFQVIMLFLFPLLNTSASCHNNLFFF